MSPDRSAGVEGVGRSALVTDGSHIPQEDLGWRVEATAGALRPPGISWRNREGPDGLEPPTNLRLKKREGECLTEIGAVTYQDCGDVFGIDLASRLRHLALIGKTGTGKSTLLENLIASHLLAAR